jgi:hypothetical protein
MDDKASEDQIFNALPGVFGDTPGGEKTPGGVRSITPGGVGRKEPI